MAEKYHRALVLQIIMTSVVPAIIRAVWWVRRTGVVDERIARKFAACEVGRCAQESAGAWKAFDEARHAAKTVDLEEEKQR